MDRRRSILLIGWLLVSPLPVFAAPSTTFEKDIRPILKAHCFDCHGEGEKLRGGLDLRLRRLIVKGGENGPAVVAGKPQESLLYQRVRAGEMPPGKKKLSPDEVERIARWIREGATAERPEPEAVAAGMIIVPRTARSGPCSPSAGRPSPPARARPGSPLPSTRFCWRSWKPPA